MFNKIRKNIANFIAKGRNSISLPEQFRRYGTKAMTPDWTQVVMSEEDSYTGYSYAAIRNRANIVARAAMENIETESEKKDAEEVEHPYIEILENSPTFTDYQFWYNISTYLDLKGDYYLMAIRNFTTSGIVGHVQEFKMINPYFIRRVLNPETLEVEGYIETRGGLQRTLPKEMIIPIRELNPFTEEKPFSMTEAAQESQFTIKTAGDFTRHTLKHNINSPGILSTDVILEDEHFKNFQERVKNNTKGEPIFGNGKGAISWDPMNIDLSKSALNDVNEMNREALFSIAGVSKTIMGIEQSGTTRETAKVQKDLLIELQALPRIQLIIDALNQDYRNNYPKEFLTDRIDIVVNNPTATDHDADLKDTEAKQKKADLYIQLLKDGFDSALSAQYVEGKIDVDQLGEANFPDPVITDTSTQYLHDHTGQKKNRQINNLITQEEGALQNAIVNIDAQLVATCIVHVEKKTNDFEEQSDVITKKEKSDFVQDLGLVLLGFYGLIFSLQGGDTMRGRVGEFALPGTFKMTKRINDYIQKLSNKVAISHVNTVVDDVLSTTRAAALEGKGQKEIVRMIQKKYNGTIAETRAKTIARTETNRAFTRAQYEADQQFIDQNKLKKRAYKQWLTRSGDPCAYCQELEDMGPIPFSDAFAELGDDITVDGKSLAVDFESLEAGNAHPNCSCIYQLIIQEE